MTTANKISTHSHKTPFRQQHSKLRATPLAPIDILYRAGSIRKFILLPWGERLQLLEREILVLYVLMLCDLNPGGK